MELSLEVSHLRFSSRSPALFHLLFRTFLLAAHVLFPWQACLPKASSQSFSSFLICPWRPVGWKRMIKDEKLHRSSFFQPWDRLKVDSGPGCKPSSPDWSQDPPWFPSHYPKGICKNPIGLKAFLHCLADWVPTASAYRAAGASSASSLVDPTWPHCQGESYFSLGAGLMLLVSPTKSAEATSAPCLALGAWMPVLHKVCGNRLLLSNFLTEAWLGNKVSQALPWSLGFSLLAPCLR